MRIEKTYENIIKDFAGCDFALIKEMVTPNILILKSPFTKYTHYSFVIFVLCMCTNTIKITQHQATCHPLFLVFIWSFYHKMCNVSAKIA